MRSVLTLALFATACVEDAMPTVEPVKSEIVQATVTSTRAPTPQEIEVEEEEKEDPEVVNDKRPNACSARAPWIDVGRCAHDGSVYASGSIPGIKDPGLARTTAGDRARRALVDGKAGKLEQSEVIDFYRCKGTSYALARMPKAGDAKVAACDAASLAARSPVEKGCPEWVRGIAWKDDEGIAGVGAARMKNSSLAQATAANRAKAEIAKLMSVELDGAKSSAQSGAGYSELKRDKAICGGTTYVKVVVRTLRDDH